MMPEKDPTYPTGLPLQFPSALAAFHAPLPVDQRTHDARYVWDPSGRLHHGAFHPPTPHSLSGSGLASPSLSELSFLHQRRAVAGSPVDLHALHSMYRVNPYMDQMCGSTLHASPAASLRGLSPLDARGLPVGADYYNMSGLAGRCLADPGTLAASTLGGSTEFPFSLESSRLNSPRPSSIRQTSRKRALSASPFSDSFDINSMIRFSPNSLVSIVNGSRSSSASGSYGHLSADLSLSGALSPAFGMHPVAMGSGHLQQLQHLMRTGSLPSSPHFLTHNSLFPSTPTHISQQGLFHSPTGCPNTIKSEDSIKKELPSLVSSTVESPDGCRKTSKVKKETSSANCLGGFDDKGTEIDPMKDEPGDFVETHCHWKECDKEFNIQDELVKHINNDHIHANKKSFICRWKDCSREEKPFKAQYMLVVHMRRHTGEKPHRCTFEGCAKAYSRLENLKTHLRSHTGEKPYMCEFPGCTKAFSNASDRAKHQNRTHSNEKPYVCKAPGCNKRYTDPSSLRKHVKTVHGPEFYASKKHKGNDQPCNKSQRRDDISKDFDGGAGNEASPARSEECSGKTTSISSPSIKSEDPTSPNSQKSQGSPAVQSDITSMNYSCPSNEPISDNVVSTTNEVSDYLEESDWTIGTDVEDIETPELGVSIVNVVNSTTDARVTTETISIEERNDRNRMKARMNLKGLSSSCYHPPISGGHRRTISSSGEPVKDPTEVKTQSRGKTQSESVLSQRGGHMLGSTTTIRRDSNSTVSSYYGSMKSDVSPHPLSSQFSSRRNSEVSQVSSQGGNNRLATIPSPGYDPISPGSSRRSSDISITPQSLPANLSSNLQKFHSRGFHPQEQSPLSNLVVQTQKMALDRNRRNFSSNIRPGNNPNCLVNARGVPNREIRRASDPVKPSDHQPVMERGLTRHNSYSSLHNRKYMMNCQYRQGSFHPNSNFQLDQMNENQMVEDRLVIPDEMATYLNQVEGPVEQDPYQDKGPVPTPRHPHPSTPYSNKPVSSPGYSTTSVCSQTPKSPSNFNNAPVGGSGYVNQSQNSSAFLNQTQNGSYASPQHISAPTPLPSQNNTAYPNHVQMNPTYTNQMNHQFPNQPQINQQFPPHVNEGPMYQPPPQSMQNLVYPNNHQMGYSNNLMPQTQTDYNTPKPNNIHYCAVSGQHNYPQAQTVLQPISNSFNTPQLNSVYPNPPHVPYSDQSNAQSALNPSTQISSSASQTQNPAIVPQGTSQPNQPGNYQYSNGNGVTTGYPQSLPSPAQANYNQAGPGVTHPQASNTHLNNPSIPSPAAATPAPQCFHQPMPPPYPSSQTFSDGSGNTFSVQQYSQNSWPQPNTHYPSESYQSQNYQNYSQSQQNWQGQTFGTVYTQGHQMNTNVNQMSYTRDMSTPQPCSAGQVTPVSIPLGVKHTNQSSHPTQGYPISNTYQVPRQEGNAPPQAPAAPYSSSEARSVNRDKSMVPLTESASGNSQSTVTMKPDTYQRTLEYVQQCQSWTQKNSSPKTSGPNACKPQDEPLRTHAMLSMSMGALYPMNNMVVNDMNSSVSSLIEESKYYQAS